MHLDKSLSSISDAISSLTDESEPCLIQQYGEQVHDIEITLGDTRNTLLSMDLDGADTLMTTLEHLDKGVFDCSLKIKRLMCSSTPLADSTTSSTPSAEGSGVKQSLYELPQTWAFCERMQITPQVPEMPNATPHAAPHRA